MGGSSLEGFFDVRVFNPSTPSYWRIGVPSLYREFEPDKQRMYEQHIRDVKMGSFTPLVFSTFGGMVQLHTGGKHHCLLLRTMVVRHHGLGAPLVFLLLRSAVTCLCGARSHHGSPVTFGALDFA